jgi:NAD(P)H-nitrite reductase large subunit
MPLCRSARNVRKASRVRLADGTVVARDAVVVAPRSTARSNVLAALGLAAEPQEMGGAVFGAAVPSNAQGATAVPGVYVAGNVTDLRAQVVVAAAAGLTAAAQLNADLVAEDTRRAVAARRGGGGVTACDERGRAPERDQDAPYLERDALSATRTPHRPAQASPN